MTKKEFEEWVDFGKELILKENRTSDKNFSYFIKSNPEILGFIEKYRKAKTQANPNHQTVRELSKEEVEQNTKIYENYTDADFEKFDYLEAMSIFQDPLVTLCKEALK